MASAAPVRVPRRIDLVAYFVSFLTGDSATQILTVAIGWSVYQIHHRAFDLGLIGLAMFSPALLLVLVTGHVADHTDRKRSLITVIAAEAVFAVVLGALVFAHVTNLALILTVIFAIGVARAFAQPLENTILVSMVAPDRYLPMHARYASLSELVVIVSPAIGGAIVAFSSVAAFVVAAAMTFAAALLLTLVRVPKLPDEARKTPFSWRSAFDGFHFIRTRPVILGAISLDLFAVLFGGATALLPIYADSVLHAGALGYGILRGSSGIGASLTAVVLSRRPPARRIGPMLLTTVAGYGVAIIVFAYSRTLWLSVVALAAAGGFDMVSVVIRRGLVQLNTPDAMRGRVAAVRMVFVGASSQLGAFESGTLAQFVGAVPAVAIGGIMTLGIVATWSLLFPDLRRTDVLVPEGGTRVTHV